VGGAGLAAGSAPAGQCGNSWRCVDSWRCGDPWRRGQATPHARILLAGACLMSVLTCPVSCCPLLQPVLRYCPFRAHVCAAYLRAHVCAAYVESSAKTHTGATHMHIYNAADGLAAGGCRELRFFLFLQHTPAYYWLFQGACGHVVITCVICADMSLWAYRTYEHIWPYIGSDRVRAKRAPPRSWPGALSVP